MDTPKKSRLDVLVHERGMADSRQKAQALILAGKILVNGQKVTKAGTSILSAASIEMIGQPLPYVGRGGLKLAAALGRWHINPAGMTALDVGSSTGGFTDCLLQHGAARVHAVDSGTNQLDWRLRSDARVHVLENTNARYLAFAEIGEVVDIICIDVSFISVRLILPALRQFCRTGTQLVLLVKPQFEAGRDQVGKGGIVRDAAVQEAVIGSVRQAAAEAGFESLDHFPCPVLGAQGNQEFLLYGIFQSATNAPAIVD